MSVPDSFPQSLRDDARIVIISLRNATWREEIFQHLHPPFSASNDDQRGAKPFLRILDIAKHDLQACAAVIEPYVSTDWSEEFGAHYARTFSPPPQTAARIHFFREHSPGKCLEASDLFIISNELREAYLGYTVLRPLPAYRVGDTVLKTTCTADIMNSDGERETMYLSHCAATFRTSLLGNPLEIKGMPFFQQETTVGVCAEADLWMLARHLNRLGEAARYRPAQIFEIATRTVTVGRPRDGLTDEQIVGALRGMGLSSQAFWPKDPDEARDFLYSCVESSLPVIAAVGDRSGSSSHVLVVIGHDYLDPMTFSSGQDAMSELVQHFYVHDDAAGPYLPMKVSQERIDDVDMLMLGDWAVQVCFVPLPARIHIHWKDVSNMIMPWLSQVREFAQGDLADQNVQLQDLWPEGTLENLIHRTYLRRSHDFKNDLIRRSGTDSRDLAVIAQYRCLPMPRYVWVIEFGRKSDFEGDSPYSRRICGEMVLDSTANRHATEEALLAFHVDGLLYVPGRADRPPVLVKGDTSATYCPLLRSDKEKK